MHRCSVGAEPAPARGSAYELGGGRSIVFVAVAGGPPERDELALAQVLLAAHYLARFEGLPRVVQELPRDLERVLAELKLEELGVAIDTMPPARRAFE